MENPKKTTIGLETDQEPPNPVTKLNNPSRNEESINLTIEPQGLDQLSLDLSTMYEAENDFGLVPGSEGLPFEDGVPSSLDELVDWLDIAGGEAPAKSTAAPHGIQPYSTFSTDDKWPI